MPGFDLALRAKKGIAVAALVLSAALSLPANAQTPQPTCDAPLDLLRLANPLSRVAHKLAAKEPIVIVAIGSSSTWGAGASSPAANYPNRLADELKVTFPTQSFTVLNRGVGGEEVPQMLMRFDTAVIAEKPDLVLWQIGTNSVIRDHMSPESGLRIRDGLSRIRAIGADIVLVDPQFAPKVIVKPEVEKMVDLISATAKLENVGLFRRFAVMKRWHVADNLPFETFVSPDGLHMNDWGYACMAKGLGMAIAEAAQRPIMSATARPSLAE
ncbi:MAG: SGNH/GDSL hydrolase family protein [Pseudolabrys sp.]